jgi:hypothetical protein
MKGKTVSAAFCLILLGMSCAPAAAQAEQKAFASVPETIRARLIERFQLLLFYETSEQWDHQYDLLESRYPRGKAEYVTQRQRNSSNPADKWIFDFVVESAEVGSDAKVPADYSLVGYAKVRERGCLVKRKGFVYAFLRSGEWYFSGFIVELPTSHAPPAPCLVESKERLVVFPRPQPTNRWAGVPMHRYFQTKR